ncbi:MAG: hypothetical protein J6Y62_07315 [Clostridia bacterium]|nr:hypothetical protein [Clostridia bacterium]
MTRKSVSGGWKAVVLILFFLAELVLCAGILANIESVNTFLSAHGMAAVMTFLTRTLYFLIEIGAAVVLIIDTMIVGITKVTRRFPSLMTVLAFIYNDLAVIATVFGLYMFGQPKSWFPYPLAFLIPAITFLLALICLIDDFIHDKGYIEEAPNMTKIAGQQTAARAHAPAAPEAPAVHLEERPVRIEEPEVAPVEPEEPAFFVTPATEEQWAAKTTEPDVVPATESVQVPVHSTYDTEPVVTSHISADNVSADAVAAVDDLFAAFLGSDYVEDDD